MLTILMVVIFFRLEIVKFFRPYLKYNQLMVPVCLIGLSYMFTVNDSFVDTFILVVEHNIQLLKHMINQLFNSVYFHSYIEELSDYIFRGLILGFLMFYPYRYKKKFSSIVYATQTNCVNTIYIFSIVVFCLFCGRFGI